MDRNRWERFLDSLDSAGGHLVILLLLVGAGVFMQRFGLAKGEDILIGAFGALLGALKIVHSNFTRLKNGDGKEGK